MKHEFKKIRRLFWSFSDTVQDYVQISKVSLRFSEPHKKSCILRSFFVSCVNLGQNVSMIIFPSIEAVQFSFFNESLFILAVMESKSLGIFLFQNLSHWRKCTKKLVIFKSGLVFERLEQNSIWSTIYLNSLDTFEDGIQFTK